MITCKRIANNNTFHPRVENRTSVYRNRFFFQGREYDYPIQLYHFRARWYDPETGRWLSNDPIGISGGHNFATLAARAVVEKKTAAFIKANL